jgi:hypothetical protein
MEEETIKHSNGNKDKDGDKEKFRGKYMDINEAIIEWDI